MSAESYYYSWINFDFFADNQLTYSPYKLVAAYNNHDIIVVWEQDDTEYKPSLKNGQLLCVILNQFNQIQQIQWVIDEPRLFIRDNNRNVLWDPYQNELVLDLGKSSQIRFIRKLNDEYIILYENGDLQWGKRHHRNTDSSLIWNTESSINIYPNIYSFNNDDDLISTPYRVNRAERRLKRNLESNNGIKIQGELIQVNHDEVIPELLLPKGLGYQLNLQDDIILHNYSDMVLFRTSKFTIIIAKNVPLPHGVIIRSEYMNAIYISTPLNYFICYTENDEYVVYRKNDKIVIENNRQIQHTQLAIRRLLPYFYLNMKPQLDYCRGDWENGYIIISDNPSNYTFYDIVSFNGSYFTQKQDDKNYYCLIEENGQYCLIWYRGEKYPLGTLQLQNLIDPDQSKITIYNVNKIETGSKEKFLEVEEKEIVKAYPLFLPEWNEIDLWIHYNGRRLYLQKISETIAFLLFDRITLQNNIELLELYEEVSEEYAFLKYGNLNIEYHGNLFHYEGVSPIWLLQKDLGLLITANIDQEAYIWDLNQKIQLPIGNFPVKLPYSFAFANNRRFVAGISFSVNEKIFLSANKNFSKIESEYPIITCHVYDIERKKHFSRNYRFPIKIINKDISIEFIDKTIVFLFPSFIDLDNQTKIIFDTEKNKFSISHLSKHKRYWITHSINSPFNLIQKAEEFPVEPNPEIKREFQMRRSMIADRDLVRKSDQIVIGSIFQGFQLIEQKSNSLLYSDEKTTEIQLPYFYNDIFKPIKVELNMYELFGNDELLNLPNLSEIPILMIGKFDLLRQDEAYLNRLKEGLNYLINLECSHDETGISFSQNKVEIYQSRLELLLEAIDDLLVQFRD